MGSKSILLIHSITSQHPYLAFRPIGPNRLTGNVLATLQRILDRRGRMELPGSNQLESFLRHVARRNRRPRTLCSLSTSVMLFLGMLEMGAGVSSASSREPTWRRLSSESRIGGIKITTIRTRLVCVYAFLRYLIDEKLVSPDVFGRRIRLQLPERLLRDMDPVLLVIYRAFDNDSEGKNVDVF